VTWRQLPAIWAVDGLRPMDRLVLLALAYFADADGANSYPAQRTLARMCSCSPDTIKRALRKLRELELISPSGTGRKGTVRYTVALPLAALPRNREGAPAPPPRVHPCPPILGKNPLYPGKKGNGFIIDKFSDLRPPLRPHPDSPPEPGWRAVERSWESSKRSRQR